MLQPDVPDEVYPKSTGIYLEKGRQKKKKMKEGDWTDLLSSVFLMGQLIIIINININWLFMPYYKNVKTTDILLIQDGSVTVQTWSLSNPDVLLRFIRLSLHFTSVTYTYQQIELITW